MSEKQAPTPEKIGVLVAEFMDSKSLDPMQMHHWKTVVTHLRKKFRTTEANAVEWLDNALEEGTVITLVASNDGIFISQIKKNTMKPSSGRFMLDRPDGLNERMFAPFVLDAEGLIHRTGDDGPAEDIIRASNESHWVTTPRRFKRLVAEINAWTAVRYATLGAEQLLKNNTIETQAGESIDYITGLVTMFSSDILRIIRPWINSKGDIAVEIDLRSAEQINSLGEILKKIGIQPNRRWREYL